MPTRRVFLRLMTGGAVIGWIGLGCLPEAPTQKPAGSGGTGGGGSGGSGRTGGSGGGRSPDASPTVDAVAPDASCGTTIWYDTYAVALYMDGSIGPTTGTITAQFLAAGMMMTFDFWHGHDGILHRFAVTPAHIGQLLRGQRVMIETTIVADHTHMLFIDPMDSQWRLPGAQPQTVPLPCP